MGNVLALNKSQRLYADFFVVFCASLLISLSSCIKIPLFFTPIPLVVQNSLAVALGAFLGPKKGSWAVFLFLVYGCLNLPVFSGGVVGVSALLSPYHAGYLLGYWAAAFLVGKILEKKPAYSFLAFLVGHLTILILGSLVLSLTIGLVKAFYLGFIPFVATDVLKCTILAKIFNNKHLNA